MLRAVSDTAISAARVSPPPRLEAFERRAPALGEPLREASVWRREVLAEASFEARDLLAELEHQEIRPAFGITDVLARRLGRDGRAAVRARHVIRVREGRHALTRHISADRAAGFRAVSPRLGTS